MLELRPICENCAGDLPPQSTEARICSFECTFCRVCALGMLENVCPNCGGGLYQRPVRPANDLKNGNYLGNHPASQTVKHRAVDPAEHARFAAAICR